MLPASDDFIMTQERSSFFDIPRSAIISQHLSLSESFWCVYKTKKEIEIFHLQDDEKISIFTYIHFYKPQEDTENKIYNLEIEGKSVGESFTRVLDFLKK